MRFSILGSVTTSLINKELITLSSLTSSFFFSLTTPLLSLFGLLSLLPPSPASPPSPGGGTVFAAAAGSIKS